MKAFYDKKPQAFESVGNGSSLFRYNIEKETMNDEDSSIQWKCEEVVIWGNLTREKVVQAVISNRWTISEENKIMNDYIGATNSFFTEDENAEYIVLYNEFLEERKELKNKANTEWETFNE